jgi:hypothetical protein
MALNQEVKMKRFLVSFIKVFLIAFPVAVVITYLWNLIVNHTGLIDWATAFRLAVIIGVITGLSDIFNTSK